MMDFVSILVRKEKDGSLTVYPEFLVDLHHDDLMIKGKSFYAVWDESEGIWSTKEGTVKRLIDDAIWAKKKELEGTTDDPIKVQLLKNFSSHKWSEWQQYVKASPDDYTQLNSKIIFSNSKVKKSDYASHRLPYPLEAGDISAYEELLDKLYSPENREKIEWAIGSIVAGDSTKIQKFFVLYGAGGTGKSTVLNIIQMLFDGYYCIFDAKSLGSGTDAFPLEPFKNNPLIAIDGEGKLDKIIDNTKLNSIVAHETLMVNEKYKTPYPLKFNALLFIASNNPVRITDAKSGVIRRLIDIKPTGEKFSKPHYDALMERIKFELGAIAKHCLDVYRKLGPNYYSTYSPVEMIAATNDFYDFVESDKVYDFFSTHEYVTLTQAYAMYKEYCTEANVFSPYPRRQFGEELKNYFEEYHERYILDGVRIRSCYLGFLRDKFYLHADNEPQRSISLVLDCTESLLDVEYADQPAQYYIIDESGTERLERKWVNNKKTLKDIDTHKLHAVQMPPNHIVIDFDLKDENGEKSLELNLEEASKWPPTYAEFSKSGKGIHLHYIYEGDTSKLAEIYSPGIDIKVQKGDFSLRRMLTRCNNVAIATLSAYLPLKKEKKKVINTEAVKDENYIRKQIVRALNKKVHEDTTSNIHYIKKVLDDAYNSGMKYDVTDLRDHVRTFAENSTNQAQHCKEVFMDMHFTSDWLPEPVTVPESDTVKIEDFIIFDIEVFPNVVIVCFKKYGKGQPVTRLFNPTVEQVEWLMKKPLVGFNCRRYDNHILYALYLGWSNIDIYNLSQDIIVGEKKNVFFKPAYNISKTDVFDFSSEKMSLKKWEYRLNPFSHLENQYPWDQDLPRDKWEEVADYCENDVLATEMVFDECKGDFLAREMLADVASMTVNDTTNTLTTRIIFGSERNPQLVYTDLTTGEQDPSGLYPSKYPNAWPEYAFVEGKNMYKGVNVGKGGLVWAKPGMYHNVWTFDSTSHHPHSAIAMNYFGKYTPRFEELLEARVALKKGEFDKARTLLDGKLAKYLTDTSDKKTIKLLIKALKIAINSVYGLTSASFPNPFKHPKNVNNIVALRGALFMFDLKDEVEKMGYEVIHIKTDSIKVVDPDEKLKKFIDEYAAKYGYEFAVEDIYERICLVNDAVYIAKCAENDPEHPGEWTATGDQFKVPYVFKTLFSKEEIIFKDLCETKSVSTAMYLDFDEDLPEGEHDYKFVGKVGMFCPVVAGCGGGRLVRLQGDKYNNVESTTGYRWKESMIVRDDLESSPIDMNYYISLAEKAKKTIEKFGSYEAFYAGNF